MKLTIFQQLKNAWINLAFMHCLLSHLLFYHFQGLDTLLILSGSAAFWRMV
jgi:hypothetical protein